MEQGSLEECCRNDEEAPGSDVSRRLMPPGGPRALAPHIPAGRGSLIGHTACLVSTTALVPGVSLSGRHNQGPI